MSTTVVSGRVATSVSEQAARVIKAAGLTPASLIKSVWEGIAQTGRLPSLASKSEQAVQKRETFARFLEFSDSLPPCSEKTAQASNQEIRKMAAQRHV